jgi:hypothetical protein
MVLSLVPNTCDISYRQSSGHNHNKWCCPLPVGVKTAGVALLSSRQMQDSTLLLSRQHQHVPLTPCNQKLRSISLAHCREQQRDSQMESVCLAGRHILLYTYPSPPNMPPMGSRKCTPTSMQQQSKGSCVHNEW